MKTTRAFLFMLMLAAALTLPAQSSAQSPDFDAKSSAWWNQMEQQLAKSLTRPVDQVRDETMQHIVFFATNYGDKMDFARLTPELLNIYENDRNEASRTMAVMALRAIGNRPSMNRLARLVEDEPPGSLRSITMAVLADFNHNS